MLTSWSSVLSPQYSAGAVTFDSKEGKGGRMTMNMLKIHLGELQLFCRYHLQDY